MKSITKILCMSLLLCPVLNAGNGTSRPRVSLDPDEYLKNKFSSTATLETKDFEGKTVLHHAAQEGNLGLVATYLERGAQINESDNAGLTPIYDAIDKKSLGVIDLLLENGATAVRGKNLVKYAMDGGKESVSILLSHNVRINEGALARAVMSQSQINNLAVVRAALAQGNLDINWKDEDGDTLLINSLSAGVAWGSVSSEGATRLLLMHGADGAIASQSGISPINLASREGLLWSVKELLKQNPQYASTPDIGKEGKRSYPLDYYAESSRSIKALSDALVVAGGLVDGVVVPVIKEDEDAISYDPNGFLTQRISAGADVNTKTAEGKTVLHDAATLGNIGLIATYLEQGVDINALDNEGLTPLDHAIKNERNAAIDLLLDMHATSNQEGGAVTMAMKHDKDNAVVVPLLLIHRVPITQTALQKAVTDERYINVVRAALAQGDLDINAQDEEGNSLLMQSLMEADPVEGVARILLKHGARGDVANNKGIFPIHRASFKGLLCTVKALLKQNKAYASQAYLEEMGNGAQYPLEFYAEGRADVNAIVDELIAAGASTKDSIAPIKATLKANLPALKKFIASGCDPDVANKDGETSLMIAIAYNKNEIARFLLAHPDVKKTAGKNGKTLLHYAVKNKDFPDIIKEIQEKYAIDINAVDENGDTALHYAERDSNTQASRILRELGATEIKNKKGETPSDIADKK